MKATTNGSSVGKYISVTSTIKRGCRFTVNDQHKVGNNLSVVLQLCGLDPRFATFLIESGHSSGECGITNGVKVRPVDQHSFHLPIAVMVTGNGTAMGALTYQPKNERAWRGVVLRSHIITRLKTEALHVTNDLLEDLYALRIKELPVANGASAGSTTVKDALDKARRESEPKLIIKVPIVSAPESTPSVLVAKTEVPKETPASAYGDKKNNSEACTPIASNETDRKVMLSAIAGRQAWVGGAEFTSHDLHTLLNEALGVPVEARAMPGIVTVLRNRGYIVDVEGKHLTYKVGTLPAELVQEKAVGISITAKPAEEKKLEVAPHVASAPVSSSIEERVLALQKQVEAAATYEKEFLRLKDDHTKVVAKITALQEEQRGLEMLMQDLGGKISSLPALRQKLVRAEALLKQAAEALE